MSQPAVSGAMVTKIDACSSAATVKNVMALFAVSRRVSTSRRIYRRPGILILLLVSCVALLSPLGLAEEKLPPVSIESFVSSLDRDGDGEICTEEANKFLEKLETCNEGTDSELQDCRVPGEEAGLRGRGDNSNMAALMNSHNLDISFNYGGSSISASEMTDHLEHMLTGDRVVSWVIHGLRLPQYAEAFELNSIDGLDFPDLISDNGAALKDELGVTSTLHKNKILAALVRQVFGIGQVPDPPGELACRAMKGGIMLHWDPPRNPGIPPLHKFLIRRRKFCALSGAKGSWKVLGDTAEESWMDSDDLEDDQEYEYRVQSWNAHGPSPWVNVTSCRQGVMAVGIQENTGSADKEDVLGRRTSDGKDAPLSPGNRRPAAGSSANPPGTEGSPGLVAAAAAVLAPRAAATVAAGSSASPGPVKEQAGDTVWGFVWSVNGGIVVLGLLSRSSFIFRALTALCAFLWHCLLKVTPAPNSPSPAVRRLAHAVEHLCEAADAVRLALMGAMGLHDSSHHVSRAQARELHDNKGLPEQGRNGDRSNGMSSGSDGTLVLPASNQSPVTTDPRGAQPHGESVRMANSMISQPGPLAGSSKLEGGRTSDGSFSESGSNSGPDRELVEASKGKASALLVRLSSQEKAASSKNRCNAEGCSIQFNTLMGFVESMKKHYCRDCQSWYCARHTRIASHSTNHCRFDSQCRCYSCFSLLPAASQSYLESINTMQAQKSKRDAPDDRPGLKSSVWKSSSEGGRHDRTSKELVNVLVPGPVAIPEAKVPSPNSVRRSTSELFLKNQARAALGTAWEPLQPVEQESKKLVMRKAASNTGIEFSPLQIARAMEQGSPPLKSVLSTFALPGSRTSDSSAVPRGSDRSTAGADTSCIGGPEPSDEGSSDRLQQEGASDDAAEGGPVLGPRALPVCKVGFFGSRAKGRGSSTFERICEMGEQSEPGPTVEDPGEGHSARRLVDSVSSSTPGSSSEVSSSSSIQKQPSFGRSRSLRTERMSRSRPTLSPTPREDDGTLLLRQRCNSLEELTGLDSVEKDGDEASQREPDHQGSSGRRQLHAVKGVLRRSLNTFSNILPGGSPNNDDAKHKRRSGLQKAPLGVARSITSKLTVAAPTTDSQPN